MSHTPGPWVIVSDDEGRCFINSGGVIKAVVATCDQPVSAEHAANARLIAASPCLLKALERIAAGSTEVFDDDLQEMVPVALCFHEMEEIAAAAISKARET